MSKRHGNGVRSWKFKTGNPGPGTDRQTESQGRGGVTAYEDSVQAHTDMSMWCETALLRLTALRSVLTEQVSGKGHFPGQLHCSGCTLRYRALAPRSIPLLSHQFTTATPQQVSPYIHCVAGAVLLQGPSSFLFLIIRMYGG